MRHSLGLAPRLNNRRGAASLTPAACARRQAERTALLLRTDVRRALAEHGTPLLLLEPERVRQGYRRLRAASPSVRLHVPIDLVGIPAAVRELAAEGAGFTIASDAALELARRCGVVAERIVHTHPIKTSAQIRAAFDVGVRTFVIDHVCELVAFDGYGDSVGLLIRVTGHGAGAPDAETERFGVDRVTAAALVAAGLGRGTRIAGFALGPTSDPAALPARIAAALTLIDDLRTRLPVRFELLDLGDCFAGTVTPARAEQAAAALHRWLARRRPGLVVMAQPGLVLLSDALSVVHRAPQSATGYRVDEVADPALLRHADVVALDATDRDAARTPAAVAAAPRVGGVP